MIKRFLPLIILVAAVIGVWMSGLADYLSFSALKEHRDSLKAFVSSQPVLAPLVFIGIYATATALSLPGGAMLTISSGFLFGLIFGPLYSVIGATIGATAIFFIARSAFGDFLRKRAGNFVKRMEVGFKEDALSYLLVLRLVPLFPFWLVNIVPALLGVSLPVFVIATFFGIIPGSFVFASIGNGLDGIFAKGETPDLGLIFEPHIIIPIVGLAVLALIPVIYKKLSGKSSTSAE